MAKIIKKKSDLVEKRNRTVAINIGGYILLVLCGVLFIELGFAQFHGAIVAAMGIAAFAGLFMIHCTRDIMGIERSGVDGEAKALKMLAAGLPDTFACINNAVIWYEERHNELDLIVVGHTGVYIVEIKNTVGNISGAYSDKTLRQEKKSETKEMRNPVQQVRMHADILSRHLKANGVRTWVQGVVFFVNPKCTPNIVDVPSNGVPIFASSTGGYAVEVMPTGFNGKLNVIVGVDAEGGVTGISVVSHAETAGIGTLVAADKPNKNGVGVLTQFYGRTAGSGNLFTVNSGSNQVDAISGATVTTKAITRGVNAATLVAEHLG